MKLIYITADPAMAQKAQTAGIDRVMVDMEIVGKEMRQGHLDTVISRHGPEDVTALRDVLERSELMVRVNPLFDGSQAEIDDVIARGADRLMLPMFRHPDEVARIIDMIGARVPLTLLVETGAALARLPRIAALEGVDDVHIGLNDLHLELKLDFMFELFGSGLLDLAADTLRAAGLPFGIGGVARLGQGRLQAELILSEHMRLGSSRVILSRAFSADTDAREDFLTVEVARLRAYLERPDVPLEENREKLALAAAEIAADIARAKV